MTGLTIAAADRRKRIVRHMNEDHADSLLAYVHHYHSAEFPESVAVSAKLTALDKEGLWLIVATASGVVYEEVFVAFPSALQTPKAVRAIVVDMHHEARARSPLVSTAVLHSLSSLRALVDPRVGVKE